MKTCKRCSQSVPDDQVDTLTKHFPKSKKKSPETYYVCKECRRADKD